MGELIVASKRHWKNMHLPEFLPPLQAQDLINGAHRFHISKNTSHLPQVI